MHLFNIEQIRFYCTVLILLRQNRIKNPGVLIKQFFSSILYFYIFYSFLVFSKFFPWFLHGTSRTAKGQQMHNTHKGVLKQCSNKTFLGTHLSRSRAHQRMEIPRYIQEYLYCRAEHMNEHMCCV